MRLNGITNQLAYSTVMIDTGDSRGTGFFYHFAIRENGKHVPALVTNKHVVEGASRGRFYLNRQDSAGNPMMKSHFPVVLDDFEARWIKHPDGEIDLCAMPLASLFQDLKRQNVVPFYICLGNHLLMSANELKSLQIVEDILMVGYPTGLWDSENNMPLFRDGITASHPALNWCGQRVFVINSACFPGSSGSPVFLFNEHGYFDTAKNTRVIGDSRTNLLGVLHAGPQHMVEGKIATITVPANNVDVPISRIPSNLGYVIKAECLLELDEIFVNMVS